MPGAHDVAERFLLGGRDVHGRERAGPQGKSEIAGIAPVGLDALPRALRDQRRCGHDAVLAFAVQVPLQPESAESLWTSSPTKTVVSLYMLTSA